MTIIIIFLLVLVNRKQYNIITLATTTPQPHALLTYI